MSVAAGADTLKGTLRHFMLYYTCRLNSSENCVTWQALCFFIMHCKYFVCVFFLFIFFSIFLYAFFALFCTFYSFYFYYLISITTFNNRTKKVYYNFLFNTV